MIAPTVDRAQLHMTHDVHERGGVRAQCIKEARRSSVVASQLFLDLVAILLALGHEYDMAAKISHDRSDDRACRRCRFWIFWKEHVIELANHLARTKQAKISAHAR